MASTDAAELEGGGLPDFLRDPVGLVRRRWRWMLGVGLSALALTLCAVLLLVTPHYQATATVLMNSQQIPTDFVQTTVQEDSFESINALVGTVLAMDGVTEVLDKYDLLQDLRRTATLPDVLDTFRENVIVEQEEGIGRQARNLSSRLFTVSYRDPDSEVAAQVANDLADRLVEASTRIRQEKAALTTEFLRKQLTEIETKLRDQERLVTEFNQANRGVLPTDMEANLRKLERLETQRQALALQVAEAETRLNMLATGEVAPAANSPEARLSDIRARYAEQLALRTAEHPNVISLRRQVESLEAELLGRGGLTPAGAATTTDQTLQELRAQLAATEREIEELDIRVARTPARAEQLAALEQKEAVLTTRYVDFLNKVQEASLAENLEANAQGQQISVLSRASPPSEPERSRGLLLAGALLIALAFAGSTGLLLELGDPVVTSTAQIEDRFELPVLGTAPRIVER